MKHMQHYFIIAIVFLSISNGAEATALPAATTSKQVKKATVLELQMIEEARQGTLTEQKLDGYLATGANINAVSKDGDTALVKAVVNDRLQTVKLLLDHGAHLESNGFHGNALMLAAGDGRYEIVKLLIDRGADVNARMARSGATALMMASSYGDPRTVQLLIDHGANINTRMRVATPKAERDDTALSLAIRNHHPEVVALLKKAEAKAESKKKAAEEAKKAEELKAFIASKLHDPFEKYEKAPSIHTLKAALKIARKNIADLEALHMPELESVIQGLRNRFELMSQKAVSQAVELTEEQKRKAAEKQKLEEQKLVTAIEDALNKNDLEAAEKELRSSKSMPITDPEIQKKHALLNEQFKKQKAETLQTQFDAAIKAYEQRPTAARLREASSVIESLEELKIPQLKEYIRGARHQLKAVTPAATTTPKEAGRVSPAEKGRVSPTEEKVQPIYFICDPYGEVEQVPTAIKSAIERALHELSLNFKNTSAVKLGYGENLWRIRVGDYRIIYIILPEQSAIGIITIDARANVYEDEAMILTREEDFIRLNTFSSDELLTEAERLIKTARHDDASRAVALLGLYRWQLRGYPTDTAEYLKSLLLSATAQLKLNDTEKARELFTNLISQAIDHHAIQQQARVGLAEVEKKVGNPGRATEMLEQALSQAKTPKERKDLESRLEKMKVPSPTVDGTLRRLRKELEAAKELAASEPEKAESELEAFLKEASAYDALSAERVEANKLLNQLSEVRYCERHFDSAVQEFDASNFDEAIDLFRAYLISCREHITRQQRDRVYDYISEAELGRTIARRTSEKMAK